MDKPTTILAVDPGAISAAYAVVEGGHASVADVPVVDKMVDAAEWARILNDLQPDAVIVESVGSMPKQGVSSTFRFGMGCGLLRGVILGAGFPLYLVTPGKWKKHFGLGPDKEKARALAIRMYPGTSGLSRKKDAGRAEALLMARWFMEN